MDLLKCCQLTNKKTHIIGIWILDLGSNAGIHPCTDNPLHCKGQWQAFGLVPLWNCHNLLLLDHQVIGYLFHEVMKAWLFIELFDQTSCGCSPVVIPLFLNECPYNATWASAILKNLSIERFPL